ncbi:hypothetical protein CONPUDRAFT_168085, partial [Coniophora puteana RWD-64-598 SS2]
MHHAFRVAELLRMVLGYVAHRDLAAVSATCRNISPIASDLLWESPGSLVPLVRQIPGKFKRIVKGPAMSVYMSSHEPLTSEDWTAIRRFAKRIKRFENLTGNEFEGGRIDWVNLGVLYALSKSPTPEPLFPRLQSVHLRSRENDCVFFLPVLTTVSLKHLHFDVTPWMREPHTWKSESTIVEAYKKAASVFAEIGERCPNLETFVLPCDPGLDDECSTRCISAIRSMVPSLKRLRHFEFQPIDIDVLHHLSALPELHTMAITLPDGLLSAEQLHASAFPKINNLTLVHASSFGPCAGFIRGSPRRLRLSRIIIRSKAPGPGLKELLEAMRDNCCPSSLKELRAHFAVLRSTCKLKLQVSSRLIPGPPSPPSSSDTPDDVPSVVVLNCDVSGFVCTECRGSGPSVMLGSGELDPLLAVLVLLGTSTSSDKHAPSPLKTLDPPVQFAATHASPRRTLRPLLHVRHPLSAQPPARTPHRRRKQLGRPELARAHARGSAGSQISPSTSVDVAMCDGRRRPVRTALRLLASPLPLGAQLALPVSPPPPPLAAFSSRAARQFHTERTPTQMRQQTVQPLARVLAHPFLLSHSHRRWPAPTLRRSR